MRIASIDDHVEEGEALLKLLASRMELHKIPVQFAKCFPDGNSFFNCWYPGKYGLILLDIFLENEHGIEIAKTIRKADRNVPIVFCSTSNEFATESYEVDAGYYLVKPVSKERIDQMLSKLELQKIPDVVELSDHQILVLSQFLYSEYNNHAITIHCKENQTTKIWSSQADFLESLSHLSYILPVNPGTIINLKEVSRFQEDVFIMSDGASVPISKRKKKEITEQYKNYLFNELRGNE